jgi:hypothetical protein
MMMRTLVALLVAVAAFSTAADAASGQHWGAWLVGVTGE